MTVASRKERLEARPTGLAVFDGFAMLREDRSWFRRYRANILVNQGLTKLKVKTMLRYASCRAQCKGL